MTINLTKLRQFLIHSNQPHATGSAKVTKEPDGSRTIIFTEGDWKMHDNFFGGEPYGGRQVIHHKNTPVWLTAYYGRVHDTNLIPDKIYGFLREALQYPDKENFSRGPAHYQKENLEYQCETDGDIDNYVSFEQIFEKGKPIYWAKFIGGLVDQRFQESL